MLFTVSTKLRVADIKLSELLQVLLSLISLENKIFLKTSLLMQVKLLTLQLKPNLLSQTLISQLLVTKWILKSKNEIKLLDLKLNP